LRRFVDRRRQTGGVGEHCDTASVLRSKVIYRYRGIGGMMPRAPFLLLLVMFLSGCTKHGRLYNLETGAETIVTFSYSGSGHGRLTGTLPSGEVLKGEYTTTADAAYGWGSIYGGGGSTTVSAGAVSGKQYGTAVATGDKGTLIDCEYVTGMSLHGSGACKDNHGGKYKLMF
jgi:hypothetical protein